VGLAISGFIVQSELRQQGAAVGGSRFDGRLSAFILRNIEPILQEWEAFARSLAAGTKMDQLALRDDAESILRAVVRGMQSNQTLAQQASKSKGHGGAGGVASDRLDSASFESGGIEALWYANRAESEIVFTGLRRSCARIARNIRRV
jgi:hypothetical protein